MKRVIYVGIAPKGFKGNRQPSIDFATYSYRRMWCWWNIARRYYHNDDGKAKADGWEVKRAEVTCS